MVTLQGDFTEVVASLRRKSEALSRAAYPVSGEEIIAEIREDSAKGIGPDGKKLKAYSPKYKRWKQRKTGSSDPVTLRLHGKMLDTLTEENGVIYSHESDEIAQGNSRWRFFMGVSQKAATNTIARLKAIWNANS